MEATDREQDREKRGLYGQRPSTSHDAFIRKEFARIAAMSARERMEEALSLDREAEKLVPAGRSERGAEGPRR